MLGNFLHVFFVILLKLWFFCNMCLFFAFTTFDASIFWSFLLTRHSNKNEKKLIVAFLIFKGLDICSRSLTATTTGPTTRSKNTNPNTRLKLWQVTALYHSFSICLKFVYKIRRKNGHLWVRK